MRCKKHPSDVSSDVGVCASCLRLRLLSIIAAQAQAQSLKQAQSQAQNDSRKNSVTDFPRSVSPYISRRKSETETTDTWRSNVHHHQHQHRRFYSTPQVGPTGSLTVEIKKGDKNRTAGRFASFLGFLFRSRRSEKTDSREVISDPVAPSDETAAAAAAASRRRVGKDRERGMSPARCSDDGGSSGYSSEGWRQTPRRTPASVRRAANGRNMASLKFCLSPLVRASPNRKWNQKVVQPEMVAAGEARVPAKPYLSTATSFCKNRSRKLADFGRYNYDSTH